MKLAYVSHVFSHGGQEFMLGSLGSMMSKLGNEVNIITSSIGDIPKPDGEMKIWRLAAVDLKIGTGGTAYPFIPGFLFTRVLQRIRPDIVHAHSHLFLTSYASIRSAEKFGIPSVLTVHGVSVNRGTMVNMFQEAYLDWVGRDLLRKATVVQCLSRSEAAAVLRLQPKAKVVVIPNGVDTELFRPGISKDETQVTWVGRMVPEKGLRYLLDAVRVVSKEVKDLKMVMIGGGPLSGYVRNYVRRHDLGSNCQLVGHLPSEMVAKILGASSFFLMPSLSEGMPRSLLEAMASENAVIASRLPTIGEVVEQGHDGFLIPPGSSEAIANTLLSCLADKGLSRKLAINARSKILGMYSLPSVVNRLNALYSASL